MSTSLQMTQADFEAICPKKFSVSWSGGGTFGSCWDNELHPVAGSDPEVLTAHLEFLEQHFPNCTIGAVRAIQSSVVQDSGSEYDYYGGSVTKYSLEITREKIQDVLEEYGILEIIEG